MNRFALRSGPRKQTDHQPLRSLAELAEEFGVTQGQLAGSMAADVKHSLPVPKSVNRSNSHKIRYYNHAEMRRYWNERK